MQLIEQSLHKAIRNSMQAPEIAQKKKKAAPSTEQINFWKTINYNTTNMPQFNEKPKQAENLSEPISSNLQDEIINHPESEKGFTVEESWEEIKESQGINKISEETQDIWSTNSEDEEIEEIVPTETPKDPFPELEIVGQIHGTYIVAQSEDGFYLIDQHAAQERIKYEYFKEKVGEVNADERQTLLLPLTFHYSADEALTLKENKKALEEVGVYLEEFGQNSFVVREYPTWFPKDFESEIIEELIEQVLKERKTDIKKLREAAAIMMSCKRSIKANHYLDKTQMERLLQDLKTRVNPFTCPHGRPVIVHFLPNSSATLPVKPS